MSVGSAIHLCKVVNEGGNGLDMSSARWVPIRNLAGPKISVIQTLGLTKTKTGVIIANVSHAIPDLPTE